MSKYVTTMTIFEAAHFSRKQRERIINSYPDHQKAARVSGIPYLGEGQVFPIEEKDFIIDPFIIPTHWPCIAGIDFGWEHPTAATRLAWDRDKDIVYVNKCYSKKRATPSEHALELRKWGRNLVWAWPHDGAQHEKGSGETLASLYSESGLNMLPVYSHYSSKKLGYKLGNSLEAGIMDILTRLKDGRLKIFADLSPLLAEMRFYRREDGRLVKEGEDIISSMRYALMMLRHAKPLVLERPSWSYAVID